MQRYIKRGKFHAKKRKLEKSIAEKLLEVEQLRKKLNDLQDNNDDDDSDDADDM